MSNNGEIYHVYDEGNQYRLFKDEVQVIKPETCDHDWSVYAYPTGPYPADIEMAGHCKNVATILMNSFRRIIDE